MSITYGSFKVRVMKSFFFFFFNIFISGLGAPVGSVITGDKDFISR